MHEYNNVDNAFDPELRKAQAQFDTYLQTRPTLDLLTEVVEPEPSEPSAPVHPREPIHRLPFLPTPSDIVSRDAITQSFEVSVVPVQIQSRANRIGIMLDDIRDNQEWLMPPYTAEAEGEGAERLLERLLPEAGVKAVRRLGQHYEEGHLYRQITQVGDRAKGTFHSHFFFLDKTHPGVTRLYFVDPEHKVAHDNFIRPSITNLFGIEVPDAEDETPKVALIRFRVPEYDPKHKPEDLGFNDLRMVIEQVLDNDGQLPDRLTGDAERQVLFMIAASSDYSRVQGRYSSRKQIDAFARGEKGSSALEGKLKVQAHVINRLIKLFNHPAQAREVA